MLTCSACSGIGLETAILFAKEGANVLLADISAPALDAAKAKVKQLESETTQKEQEITSLSHKNSVLEGEVEKLETQVKTYKDEAGAGAQAGSTAEGLQRKIQVLEEEAEESDRTIRELNEKCVRRSYHHCIC